MRQADELSITTAPAAAYFGASAFEVEPPAENSAISMPVRSAVSASSTTISSPRKVSVLPAEREEAIKRRRSIGKLRSSSRRSITEPT
ncbi:unannotated protein [freshwater metagenome]|uniref:Unannotated protein n=1 Tax=freshwater metagenome TaxID=449393 RepID=A0A6J6LHN0_9ZZZZ